MKNRIVVVTAIAALVTALGGATYLLSRPKIAFVGFPDQMILTAEKAGKKAGVRFDQFTDEVVDKDAAKAPNLSGYKVLFVNGRRAEPYSKAVEERLRAAANQGARVIVLPAMQRSVMDFANVDIRGKEKDLGTYYANGGVENWSRMFHYVSARYLGKSDKIDPPVEVPDNGYYHPDHEEVFTETAAYLKWYRESGHWKEGAPMVLVDFANGWRSGMTTSLDMMVRTLEKSGMNVAPVFGWPVEPGFPAMLKPDVIINRSHGRFHQGEAGVELLAKSVQAPVIRSLSLQFDRKTVTEYRANKDGLRGPGLSIGTIVSELDGTIAPILTEGLEKDSEGRKLDTGIQERMDRLAERIHKWARLRRLANKDKKVAVVYFAGIGKADFTAAGMNVPRSLTRFLGGMKGAGYKLPNAPTDSEALLKAMLEKGHNVAEEEAGELEKMLAAGDTTLLPVEEYSAWFDKLPAALKNAVTEAYGPAPGTFMVTRREGRSYFIIPAIRDGNVVLLPQPARGAKMDAKLQHSDTVPPPHQYLAVYYWLQHGFGADAVVHYGTHGTYEFLPGRPVGQLDDDWSDQVVGALPSIYVYTMDNVGEALLAKRRGVAEMVSHQTPPIVAAQLSESDNELASLYRLTQGFFHTEGGTLRQKMREQIRELAVKRKLDRDLRRDWVKNEPGDDEILQLDQYLDDLEEAKIPVGLHVHGVADKAEDLALTVTEILGRPFIEEAAGKKNLEGAEYRAARLSAAKKVAGMLARPVGSKVPGRDEAPPVTTAWLEGGTGHPAGAPMGSGGHPAGVPMGSGGHPAGVPMGSGGHPAGVPMGAGGGRRGSPAGGVAARMEQSTALRPRQQASMAVYAQRVEQLRADFAQTSNEISATLAALDGKYVRPGGGGDPVRAPQALPTGRNLYGVNPSEIPTRVAWDVGVKLADDLVAAERKRLGRYPKKVGFNLWATEVIRQYGADLAQVLWLLGVRPVWDERGIIVDLEVIPGAELKRPRIDVVIQAAGQFRDSFPDRMELLDKAVRMAAAATDVENFIAANSQELETTLKAQGMSAKDAKAYSLARVFSNGVGGYGTGITGGVAKSGGYTDTKSISEEYMERSGAVYTGETWGKKVPRLYEAALKNVDAVSISNSSNTISALTLDHYFEYLGGMTMAIRDAHGQQAAAYVADTRDPDKTRTLTAEEALAQDFRTQLWNRKWIEGMKDQDFSGASEITKLATNLWGWQVTRPESIQQYMWQETFEMYVQDREKLGMKEWFDSKNAFAWQVMTATMLEAIRKGYWKADEATKRTLANEYAGSVAKHGSSGSERTVGNDELSRFVKQNLEAPGNITGMQLSSSFTKALNAATEAKANTAFVVGQRLVKEMTSPLAQKSTRNSLAAFALMTGAVALWFGMRRRRG